MFQLPTDRVEDAIVAELPEPKTIIPREKPVRKRNYLLVYVLAPSLKQFSAVIIVTRK